MKRELKKYDFERFIQYIGLRKVLRYLNGQQMDNVFFLYSFFFQLKNVLLVINK